MGFTIDRFDGEVDSIFACTFCKNILQNPKMINVLECEHVFCEACILELASAEQPNVCPMDGYEFTSGDVRVPIKLFLNMYSQLKVHCSFRDVCENIVPILELDKHESECSGNPDNYVFCKEICGQKLHKDDAKNHRCGEHFMSFLNDFQKRVIASENGLKQLRQQYMEENQALAQQVDELTKHKELLEKKNREILAGKQCPQPGVASNSASITNGFVTTELHSFRTPASSVTQSAGLLQIFKIMVDKYTKLNPSSFHERIPDEKWCNTSFCYILRKLATDFTIKSVIKNFNLSNYVHDGTYQEIISCKRTAETMNLLLSLSALQFLVPVLSRHKNVMLISQVGHCFTPYFAFLSHKVTRFASRTNTVFYKTSTTTANMQNIVQKVNYFSFESEQHLIDTLAPVDRHKAFSNFSTIVSFQYLSRQTSTQLLKLSANDAILLIMDSQEGFQQSHLDSSGNIIVEVLADPQQVRLSCEFF